jgi:2'-5' RNA ligase
VRLFVALELPAAAVGALAAFRARADPEVWRPVPGEALHLTLAFLGTRPEADVERIGALVREAAGTAPRLRLAAALALPPRRPRVLTAEVEDPDGTLGALQARVSSRLAQAGLYEPEARPFRPHVTVARLRSGAPARGAPPAGPEPVAFDGLAVALFESRPQRGGARYIAHVSVALPPAQGRD